MMMATPMFVSQATIIQDSLFLHVVLIFSYLLHRPVHDTCTWYRYLVHTTRTIHVH